ncbi:exonuclease mut-7 homolog isoform X2 [Oratosquilla oratoria]|uniref:exonuclease mut-7 homolog isoform X2 n=1 Tax=Oratosquilla oratoria TaxID=337810 RepID=UPI003F764898
MAAAELGPPAAVTQSGDIYSAYFVKLQQLWLKDSKKLFSTVAQECFGNVENPYKLCLVCIKLCPDLNKGKGYNLATTLVGELKVFLSKNGKENYASSLTQALQHDAFHLLIRQRNMSFTKTVINVFNLIDIKQSFLPLLQDMLKQHRFKDVCPLATFLNLQSHFTMDELLCPLLLEDKISVIEDFLAGSPRHQKEFLTLLDNIVGKVVFVEDLIQRHNVGQIQKVKSKKNLTNVATRILKKYKLDIAICPHIEKRKQLSSLRYLFYKHFIEHGMPMKAFRSLLHDAVQDNEALQLAVLDFSVEYHSPELGAYFAKRYDIAPEKVPHQIADAMKKDLDEISSALDSSVDGDVSYASSEEKGDEFYTLKIPDENVLMIDTVDSFVECLEILKKKDLVAIDTEWKPTFGIGQEETAALLQIAISTHVYLIDIFTLRSVLQTEHWDMIKFLFTSPDITVLGYGINGDMSSISKIHDSLKDMFSKKQKTIDFDYTKKVLTQKCPEVFKFDIKKYKGLSGLVYACFGKPLDKSAQFSQWEERPLQPFQRSYAALDAWCLLEIYSYLEEQMADLELPDWKTLKYDNEPKKEKLKDGSGRGRSGGGEGASWRDPLGTKRPVPASEFKAACDTMVQGLARLLRSCGIDTVSLENEQDHEYCITLYEKEKRVVFTRGKIYYRLRKYIPANYCFCVESEVAQSQLEEVIAAYNIVVSVSDVFTRCTVCNSDRYIHVPSNVMGHIKKLKSKIIGVHASMDLITSPHRVPIRHPAQCDYQWSYKRTGTLE